MMMAALLATLLIAQSPSTQLIDSGLVEHVRNALAEAPTIETVRTRDTDRPVFRLNIRAPKPGPPLWSDGTVVPAYMLTGYPLYHYEFLAQVTPEPYRASALYPGAKGPEITPLLKELFTRAGPELRRRQAVSARREVQQALEDLSRTAATK
jgi:hypothetical protein